MRRNVWGKRPVRFGPPLAVSTSVSASVEEISQLRASIGETQTNCTDSRTPSKQKRDVWSAEQRTLPVSFRHRRLHWLSATAAHDTGSQDTTKTEEFALLSKHADRQGVDISVTACFLFVCTVTDFSGEDKASGVKFCTVVHRRPGQGISHFGELCSPRSPKSDESASHREALPIGCRPISLPIVNVTLQMRRSWNIRQRVDVGSACVDIRPSPKTDVLVSKML